MGKEREKDVDSKGLFGDFCKRMKEDKKYNAKVQLIGYGIFICVILLSVNLASMGNGGSGNVIIDDNEQGVVENTSKDTGGLLESISDNYNYEIELRLVVVDSDTLENREEVIYYGGKASNGKMIIERGIGDEVNLYYRDYDQYYGNVNGEMGKVSDEVIYDSLNKRYVEVDEVLELLDKASLDYETSYSSGKHEYVYNLKVRDVISSYKKEDVVVINVLEENEIFSMDIDYSSLFKVMDDKVVSVNYSLVVSDIEDVEDFDIDGVYE